MVIIVVAYSSYIPDTKLIKFKTNVFFLKKNPREDALLALDGVSPRKTHF